jgi:hypothetical protein
MHNNFNRIGGVRTPSSFIKSYFVWRRSRSWNRRSRSWNRRSRSWNRRSRSYTL